MGTEIKLIDLGWDNAGGETSRRIHLILEECRSAGHKKKTTNEGAYGTVHTISCEQCGYQYHEDSGD